MSFEHDVKWEKSIRTFVKESMAHNLVYTDLQCDTGCIHIALLSKEGKLSTQFYVENF